MIITKILVFLLIVTGPSYCEQNTVDEEDDIESIKINKFLLDKIQSYIDRYKSTSAIGDLRIDCKYFIVDKIDWKSFYLKHKANIFSQNLSTSTSGLYTLTTNCLNSLLNRHIEHEIRNLNLIIIGVDLQDSPIGDKLALLIDENQFLARNYSDYIKYLNLKSTNLTTTTGLLSTSSEDSDEYEYATYSSSREEQQQLIEFSTQSLFKQFKNLEILLLDNNPEIELKENLLGNLLNLKYLSLNKCNLSDGFLSVFSDEQFKMPALDYLNLSGNNLTEIKFKFAMSISFLDLSSNNFTRIDAGLINNNNINVINFDRNLIDSLNLQMTNKSVTLGLRHNRIETISGVHKKDTVVDLYLAGNPFKCDCNSLWLRNYSRDDYKSLIISDYDELTCVFTGTLESTRKLIKDSEYSDFKCQYTNNCNYMCKCCSYKHCYCFSKCPNKCKCYINANSSENVVDCSSVPQMLSGQMPRFVESASELRLSNNEITELKPSLLFGYSRLNKLYLNRNRIHEIDSSTFNFISEHLEVLDLSSNRIDKFNVTNFLNLKMLRILNLFNNSIKVIDDTFFLLNSLHNLRVVNLMMNELSVESMAVVEDFLRINTNVNVTYQPLTTTTTTTTTTTRTTTVTSISTRLTATKLIIKRNSTTTRDFMILDDLEIVDTPTSPKTVTDYNISILRNFNYYQILKICILTMCIGGLLILLIIYIAYVLHKINLENEHSYPSKPDSNKYIKFCRPLNCKETLSIDSDSTAATGIVSAASITPPKSTLSSAINTLPTTEDYCFIKNDDTACDQDSNTIQEMHYANAFDSGILASNSINDITLYIKIYYHQLDENFLSICLLPILNNIHVIPNKHIVLKPQANLCMEISDFEKQYEHHNTTTSTYTSGTTSSSSNHYYNIDSTIDRSTAPKSTTFNKFFRKDKIRPPKNILYANVIVISSKFQGFKSTVYSQLKRKNNKILLNELKNVFKVYIRNDSTTLDNNYETIDLNRKLNLVTTVNTNATRTRVLSSDYAYNIDSTADHHDGSKKKNRRFSLLFNKTLNHDINSISRTINDNSYGSSSSAGVDHVFQSMTNLEIQLSSYIESLYQKLKLKEEDDIDFHLINYRKSSTLSNV